MRIDTFTLHAGVIWDNEITEPSAIQQLSRTVLGTIRVYRMPVSKRKLVFSAKDKGSSGRGYFSRELIMHLQSAELNGTILEIEYRSILYSAIVQPGGLNVVPKRETESVDSTDVYTGTITLQEI